MVKGRDGRMAATRGAEHEAPVSSRGAWWPDMSDDEVMAAAASGGWRLEEQTVGDTSLWRWIRNTDELWPSFRKRESAVAWMRDRLQREHRS